jgi:uncharacterized short protein YbdD (DUF466 family)
MPLANRLRSFWRLLRHASGDDAYERYIAHQDMTCQGGAHQDGMHAAETPLTRGQFFKLRQDEKWSKVSRCC